MPWEEMQSVTHEKFMKQKVHAACATLVSQGFRAYPEHASPLCRKGCRKQFKDGASLKDFPFQFGFAL